MRLAFVLPVATRTLPAMAVTRAAKRARLVQASAGKASTSPVSAKATEAELVSSSPMSVAQRLNTTLVALSNTQIAAQQQKYMKNIARKCANLFFFFSEGRACY